MLELEECLQLLALFAVPVIAIGLSSYLLAGSNVRIRIMDGLLLVAPGSIWLLLTILGGGDKSLANLIELPLLGAITGTLFALRILLSRRRPSHGSGWSRLSLLGSCVAAIALWACVPRLAV